MNNEKRIPVILDTDIGGDIDDTWALAMLLKCPELEVKLVVSDTGDTGYRARICAKMLERAGRADIPVGVGINFGMDQRGRQVKWVADYDLAAYPGTVHADGVQAIIDCIHQSADPVTLICIGPVPNIAEVLKRDPAIAAVTDFTGMHGSIHKQHEGKPGRIAEFNVVRDIDACRRVFAAPWRSMTITPLDTCGIVRLQGDLYQQLLRSDDHVVRDVIDNYRIWSEFSGIPSGVADTRSSILFDTVAVHLAFSTAYLKMEKMHLVVDAQGFTVPDPAGREINVAIEWTDLEAYHRYLTGRLLGPVVKG